MQPDAGEPFELQSSPVFVEIQTASGPTATPLVPSAEHATPVHPLLGAMLGFHVVPKFVDVQMPPPFITATIVAPKVEQPTEDQLLLGALVGFQLVPESAEV